MITDIIIDWGSVLCPDNNRHAAKILSKRYGYEEEILYEEISSQECKFFKEKQDQAYFDKLYKIFEIPVEELRIVLNMVKYDEQMFNFARQLSQRYNLHLLSNQIQSRTNHIRKNYDLAFFTQTFFSNEIGLMKPEREIYLFVLETLKRRAENCIFVDDNREYLDAAKALGMSTLLFKNTQVLRRDLSKLGIQ